MSTQQRPSLGDLNVSRFVVESVPSQIRRVQAQLAETEIARMKLRAELEVLVSTALAHGVPLCPAPVEPTAANGNAAGPGGADGASIRGVAA